ncbi:hypothetical protein MMYC01_205568 [Madurella mycetomatis]|uniref:Protein kinase domain-containing protein n=1 Tax=Madurella mycetomatis TaxID=100816 RepID=A0A175W2X5_9PEZI|nr:hypothetical protein MMYC01_205568 [Madurella mycetomatis]
MGSEPTVDEAEMTRLNFRLGKRRISGVGKLCDHHRNVVYLQIIPTTFDRLLFWLLQLVPVALCAIIKSWFPESFLPSRIVLKRQKKDWDDEFDNEKAIYQTLAPVQGKAVPVCYGEVECTETETTGKRALVLSDIGGVSLHEDDARGLEVAELEGMLSKPFRALAELKVSHDDYKLDNYRLVGDKIMIIDFDSSYIFETEEPDFVTFRSVKFVSRLYNNVHRGGAAMSWL